MRPAKEFFRVTITREINPADCKKYADGDDSVFSWVAAVASLFVWICVFLAIFNGVKSSSYVIWVTVPIPICFILVMLFHGLSLDGSKDGIKDYITGNKEAREGIVMGSMWADAIG
jgi:hypothetical protein